MDKSVPGKGVSFFANFMQTSFYARIDSGAKSCIWKVDEVKERGEGRTECGAEG